MIDDGTIQHNRLVYYRIIAIWVVCETLLGGIIHSFNIPFSGIFLSGFAVMCICLIERVGERGSILKATVIVVVFKFLLSPQTPPSAYLAVFIQGILGEVLFRSVGNYRLGCILLGAIALAESALQRIILLLVLFGNNFPAAINKFVKSAFSNNVNTNYSLYLAAGYIIIHFILGGFTGYFAFTLTGKTSDQLVLDIPSLSVAEIGMPVKKKKRIKTWLVVCWLILVAALIFSWIQPGRISIGKVFWMLIRSVIILLTWYLFLSPILLYYFKKWVENKKLKMVRDIREVILLLPSTKYLVLQSWKLSANRKGLKRILLCCRLIAYNTLFHHQN